jgi:hypothetical protein
LLQHVGNNLQENILIDLFGVFLPFYDASRHSDLHLDFCVPQMQCVLELRFVWSLTYESETLILLALVPVSSLRAFITYSMAMINIQEVLTICDQKNCHKSSLLYMKAVH